MFFPLHDQNPLRVIRFQTVTMLLIVANVLLYLYSDWLLGEVARQRFYLSFGMVPAVISGSARLAPELEMVPALLTPFTSLFLHGGWLHLVGNMLFLWVFADNVEDGFGHLGFLGFYLLCGLVAGLTHLLLAPASRIPLIGASGAISGVVAAYLVLFPRFRVLSLFGVVPVRMPAWIMLGAWLAFNLVFFLLDPVDGGVAWSAHMGGFVAGLLLTFLLRRRIMLRLARGRTGQVRNMTAGNGGLRREV